MSHDVLVLGGGPDGLAAAAILAKAGRSVVLLEARDVLGGRWAREEFAPGAVVPGLLHDARCLRPALVTDLGLEGHGLGFVPRADDELVVPALDGADAIQLGAAGPRGVEPAELEGWERLAAQVRRLAPALALLFDRPPPDTDPQGLGDLARLGLTGLSLRRLGAAVIGELAYLLPQCAHDWLDGQLGDDRVKAALAGRHLGGTWLAPWSAGSAAWILIHEALAGPAPRGGPAAVTAALESAARAAGATLRTGVPVEALLTDAGGVTGARLASGETVAARQVLSTLEPRRTLLGLLGRGDVPADLRERIRQHRCRGTTAALRLVVRGPVTFAGCAEGRGRAIVGSSLDGLERAFDGVKYGRLPEAPLLDVAVPSLADPSLAPAGHQVVSVLASWVPHDLDGDWTDEARAALEACLLARLEQAAPGLGARITARELLAPPDLERRYGLTGGQLHQGEVALDRLLHLRPDPTCSRGPTPVPGLALGGAGVHPGLVSPGASGRLAARALLTAR